MTGASSKMSSTDRRVARSRRIMHRSVSDLSTPENRESMMYHHGKGAEIGDIHEELAKYNARMGTNLELPPLDL